MPQSMQESIRLAREQAQRRRQEMEEQRRRQEEEQRRQQEMQQRRYEEQMRQTAAGQAQQNGIGGIDPSTGMSIASKFMGSGSGAGAAGGSAAGASSAAGGSGAAGGASALGSAGPWGLLAAAIVGNEYAARKAGRRDDRKATHAMDLVTGKVLEQDMNYYGDKVGGIGGEIVKGIGRLGNPEGLFNVIKGAFK